MKRRRRNTMWRSSNELCQWRKYLCEEEVVIQCSNESSNAEEEVVIYW